MRATLRGCHNRRVQQIPYELLIGWRYTRAGRATRRNGFISFISGVSMLGIALGVAALIIVLSVMNGFQKEVRDRMLGVVSHVEVYGAQGQPLPDLARTMAEVRTNPQVIGVAPFIAAQALLARGEDMKGVVVRVNSPGGSATASEAIRQALIRLAAKKPVVFSMGELAASGGYWITAIGRPILAEAGTITGSIGVFGMRFQLGALMRRIGVHSEIVRLDDGPLMDAMDRPWSDAARGRMQAFVDDIYARFLAVVATSRKKTVEQVDAIAGGRVWSGQQAVDNGLVDALGGVDDAVAMVRKEASLGDDVEVTHQPEPKNFADSLFGSMFDAAVASGVDAVALRAVLARHGHLAELWGALHEALAGNGAAKVYALMPPGLRVR